VKSGTYPQHQPFRPHFRSAAGGAHGQYHLPRRSRGGHHGHSVVPRSSI